MRYIKTFENFGYELDPLELNEILKGYIEAALWTEEEKLKEDRETIEIDRNFDDEDDETDEMERFVRLNSNYQTKSIESFSREDIEDNSLIKAYQDIKQFINLAGPAVDYAVGEKGYEQLGHDFWLSRNHHGAGFFDHSYDDDEEKILMDASHKLGEIYIYINDSGKLSFSNE